MQLTFRFIARCIVFPVILLALAGTALAEFCWEGDWEYWRSFNAEILQILPWSEYPNGG